MRKFLIFILFQCLYIGQIIAQTPSALTKGLTAPDFVAKDTLGVEHRLCDFAGKVIVIDFWASWCGDCRREMPETIEVFRDFANTTQDSCSKDGKQELADKNPAQQTCCKKRDIVFLGVSMDHEAEAWKKYLRKEQLPWLQVSNLTPWKESDISKAYDLHWIPTMFVIDEEGKVIGSVITAKELRTLLQTL